MIIDEIEISKLFSYDKNTTESNGFVTLSNNDNLGNKLLLVLIRGLKIIGSKLSSVI